jgi:hypothetical protein
MLLLFAASAVLQLNDPDPVAWTAVYSAAALMCGLELSRRLRALYPALLAVAAFGWAATIAPRVLGKVPFGEMFAEFEMKNLQVEESREMYGLLIVACWMTVVAIVAWRRSKRVIARPQGGRGDL